MGQSTVCNKRGSIEEQTATILIRTKVVELSAVSLGDESFDILIRPYEAKQNPDPKKPMSCRQEMQERTPAQALFGGVL